MDDGALLAVSHEAVAAVRATLVDVNAGERRARTDRPGQYALDVAADAAALEVLLAAGLGVVSEESGATRADSALVAVIDPVDGSTNASRGLPWFACSICVVDELGPRTALVVNLATGTTYDAIRGQGARRDGEAMSPSSCRALDHAVVGVNGWPPQHLGWRQMRSLGAVALELCAVADGGLDGYVACTDDEHGPWDYLAASLVCAEAGATAFDLHRRSLHDIDPPTRRTLIAAATPQLAAELGAKRAEMD
jgi:myo-inositol-1(or 4)-monophosphatase